ncbi:MAG: DUF2306 domain-containing protein [Pseudoxanthomonas sp.]
MSAASPTALPPKPFKVLLLLILVSLSARFLWGELDYALTRDRTGEPVFRTWALIVHLTFATPLLLLPPLQFSRRFRLRWPHWHRRLGRAYLVASLIAGSLAIYLGLTFDLVGRRVPVVLFATLWVAFSAAAWWCARHRAFAAHERFVVRSYTIAVAFVIVRVMGQAEDVMFPFMPDPQLRGVTREWLCFVLPLLAVEAWYTWWPALRTPRPHAADARL